MENEELGEKPNYLIEKVLTSSDESQFIEVLKKECRKGESAIITLNELKNDGKKVSRICKSGMPTSENLDGIKNSLKDNGQYLPVIIANARLVLEQGYNLIDVETSEVVTLDNIDEYVAILDGRRRYEAHIELINEDPEYKKEFFFLFKRRLS